MLIIAGCIIAIGIITTVVDFINTNPVNDRKYLNLNSETVVYLEPGKYTIFYEYDQSIKQLGPIKVTNNNRISSLVDVISVAVRTDTAEIITTNDASMSYTFYRKAGESLFSFSIEREEQYIITVETEGRQNIDNVEITLIADFTKGIISIFKNIGLYVLGAISCLIAGIIIYIKEDKKKRKSIA